METHISLKIKTMDSKITCVSINPHNTILQLKQMIYDELQIPIDKQRLIYQGKVLENNKTIIEYKIQHEHVILLPGQQVQDQVVQQQQQENEGYDLDILSSILRTLSMIRDYLGQHQYNRQNVRRMVQQQRRFNFDRQLSMEGIRQNYSTIKQLMATQVKTSELRQEDIQNEYINPFDPKKRKFQVGQWIDVKDTIDQWLEAQVQIVEQNRIYIHYNGWGNRWDEWLDIGSSRIAIFRTYTVGGVNQDYLSPIPVCDPDCDVEKPEIDMHKFIFDVGHMMNEVTQMLIEFGKFENNKRIAKRQLQLQLDINKAKKQFHTSTLSSKEQEIHEYEVKSSLIGSQLAPIFDRMGRMMTDLAPHLAMMGQQTQKAQVNPNNQFLFQVPVTLTPSEIYQSQINAPTLHSRLEIVSNRLAVLRMTELSHQEDSDDDHQFA